MDFSHYTDEPVQLAVDLVNSYDLSNATERLDLDLAREWLSRPGMEEAPHPEEKDLAGIRRLRGHVRKVFEAASPEEASAEVSRILRQAQAIPYIGVHGQGPHLHVAPGRDDAAGWLGAVIGMALAELVVNHGLHRFGVCSAGDCRDVFIDGSRNHSRKHCSDRCTNREGVRSYRRRRGG
jgi:predicted RNA-binding Zn ribbon-like protein